MGEQKPKLYEDGNGIDVFIGHNVREVRKYCMDEYGLDRDELDDIERFTELDKTMWWMIGRTELRDMVDMFGELTVGIFAGDLAVKLTYEQAMQIYDGDIPGVISSTEW